MPLTRAASATDPARLGLPTALQQKAQALLRAAARAQPITSAATPATVTPGASNANSTIRTTATTALAGPTTSWNDARLADISGVWQIDPDQSANGYIATHVSNKASGGRRNNSNGAGKRFGFNGQAFDVLTYSGPIRVAATDLTTGLRQWYTGDVAAASAWTYTKVDFGSRAPRVVEIYFGGNSSFWGRGFNVAATDRIWAAPPADEPRLLVFGDSYCAGINNDSIKTRFADIVGERFGTNPIVSGVGGSGLLAPNAGFTWRQRVLNGDLDVGRVGKLDLFLSWGSINDNAQTDAAVRAEMALFVQAVMAAQPGAILAFAGPQFCASAQTSAARYAAVAGGVADAVAASGDTSGRAVYLDNSPAGEAWQTGTGSTASPNGTGTNDVELASDGTHLNAQGNKDVGRRIASSLVARLSALAR